MNDWESPESERAEVRGRREQTVDEPRRTANAQFKSGCEACWGPSEPLGSDRSRAPGPPGPPAVDYSSSQPHNHMSRFFLIHLSLSLSFCLPIYVLLILFSWRTLVARVSLVFFYLSNSHNAAQSAHH